MKRDTGELFTSVMLFVIQISNRTAGKWYFCLKSIHMIKTGDKVKFLNDVGGGIVKGFLNKTTAIVENADGFEIPYPVSQLVNVDAPGMNREDTRPAVKEQVADLTPKKLQPEKAKPEEKGRIIPGKNAPDFYFCLVPDHPDNPISGETGLYLLNDSNFTVLYQYSHYRDEKYTTVRHGRVKPNTRVLVGTIDESDLADLPEFGFQLLFFAEVEKEWQKPVSKRFKISPVKFYKEKSFYENPFFSANAMVLQITSDIMETEISKLTDADLEKVIRTREAEEKPKTEQKQKPAEIVEVDLHIHELLETTAGLTNAEILEVQMEKLESEMKAAIASGAKRIVFIHGVGQGVLKQEVARVLRLKFPKYDFQDASFREYGYGATMVMLRR